MDTSITTRPIIATEPVISSQIAAIGHDPQSNTLVVRFPANRKGISSVYHYTNFTAEHFQEFKSAESKGSHFIRNIKSCADQFPYENMTDAYAEAETAEQNERAEKAKTVEGVRKIIRVDGTETVLSAPQTFADILKAIGADTIDTVSLRHLGEPLHVMIVDDTGMLDNKPVNEKATELYHANCHPGTTTPIHGDVVVVPDSDFA